jgi:site-specific DNA-cytosine methylase
VSTLQGGSGKRGHRVDSEAAAGGQLVGYMPFRTLEKDGTVSEGHAERDVADAIHQSTGTGSNKSPKIAGGDTVRRLTPTECERLQGLPDGWTLTEPSDEPNPLPDGPRYAACGDAVTTFVSEWIGARLAAREDS